MAITWIDVWAIYRNDEELRAIEDPPADWLPLWSHPPKTKSAPVSAPSIPMTNTANRKIVTRRP